MNALVKAWEGLFLHRAKLALALMFAIVAFFALFISDFRLDASGDSLLLEKDEDLRYYRGTIARYGSDEYLVITYSTSTDLFAPSTLADTRLRPAGA